MAGSGGLGSYQTQLSQAQDSYSDVMSGYQSALSGQQAAQAPIQAGYGALQGQVANTLGYGGTPWGVAAPAAQSIADLYASQSGNAQQGLINSGLGNSTVLQSVQRGIGLDAAKAYGGLGAQLAQTYAGYQSQLGLAGLNYANQANQQNTAINMAQLGYQGAYHGQGYGQKQPMGGGAIGAPSSGSPQNQAFPSGKDPTLPGYPPGQGFQGGGMTPPPAPPGFSGFGSGAQSMYGGSGSLGSGIASGGSASGYYGAQGGLGVAPGGLSDPSQQYGTGYDPSQASGISGGSSYPGYDYGAGGGDF
jgi:hypothetical protein